MMKLTTVRLKRDINLGSDKLRMGLVTRLDPRTAQALIRQGMAELVEPVPAPVKAHKPSAPKHKAKVSEATMSKAEGE